ncbi:MAG TPA: heme peroxidase family protein [Terriglobales bacterium]|nr:heme peroxidase family protein [Terriglobales bacterium]
MSSAIIGAKKKSPASQHGGGVRGDSLDRRSPSFEGRFGRMFRSLPAAEWPKQALVDLGKKLTADPESSGDLPSASAEDPKKRIQDDEENAGIPAGYTYLGQFIDHDITFDPSSSLMQQNDPDALVDFRTPRLDLDSLYGRGPADQPFMYSADGRKFRLGRALTENGKPSMARDLPRFVDPNDPNGAQRALIGDKRNDENVIISQLHSAMIQLHNRFADRDGSAPFEKIQQRVRWYYQWVVVNDFLVKICGEEVVHDILPHLGAGQPIWKNLPHFAFYKWHEDPFMPIEFSAAAYRFGHSMVRPIYRLNTELAGGDDPGKATKDEEARGLAGRFFIFAGVQKRGLNGFDEFPSQWAIDWSLFFDIKGSINKVGKERVQPAYKIDTSLVNPLGFLPEFSTPPAKPNPPMTVEQLQSVPKDSKGDPSNLAERNLLRGMAMGLPSGQSVALAMGVDPIDDENLRIGKAVVADWDKNKPLASFHSSFTKNAPLWFYVLAEAQWEWIQRAKAKGGKGDEEPLKLGTVGARIVAETLIGLLWGDGHSYIRQAPNWMPEHGIRNMGDLIDFALTGANAKH